jgi:hypothetical protein
MTRPTPDGRLRGHGERAFVIARILARGDRRTGAAATVGGAWSWRDLPAMTRRCGLGSAPLPLVDPGLGAARVGRQAHL